MSVHRVVESTDAIAFAERVLALLDTGAFTSTYKFAVLLGLMDLVVEKADESGILASMITTRQLAEKIVDVYWGHTVEYSPISAVPKQNKGGQAEVVNKITQFREGQGYSTLFKAKASNPSAYLKLLNHVEKKLIEMPLPRLQYFGQQECPFIYAIAWGVDVNLKEVTAYQNGKPSEFDNRINLAPQVANYFVSLNGLLRPLIQRTWTLQVAKTNKLEESKLERFLFDSKRSAIAKFSVGLSDIQNGRCFYCDQPLGNSGKQKPEVDHFIPWARYPNDGLANFVVAHSGCNNSKSDHVAAFEHYDHWKERNNSPKLVHELEAMAASAEWDLRLLESNNIAHALYGRLNSEVELWRGS